MIRHFHICAAAAVIVSVPYQAAAFPQNVQTAVSSARTAPAQTQEIPPVTGKVVQSMNSGGYSYVLLKKTGDETVWVAMPETRVVVGEQMTLRGGMQMTNFESKSLKRKFDSIIFSEGPVSGGKSGAAEKLKSPGSKGALTRTTEKIKVEKAAGPNSRTVAEIYRLKAKLNKRKVAVRGKVVKVSSGIMGKNWIHLQDGTGSAKKGTNNLVVTSQALPLVGDIVTASGTIYKDKDFGGGYKYDVIMEKADIAIQ